MHRPSLLSAAAAMALLAGCASTNPGLDNSAGRKTVYVDPATTSSQVAGVGIESQDVISMTDKMMRDVLATPQIAGRTTPPRIIIDSADFIDRELQGQRADVLCLCAIGRKYRPGYVRSAVELLNPRYVVACHWDWFFTPYPDEPRLLPGVDLPGFVREVRAAGAEALVLPFDGRAGFDPA